jgi:hypothetical protein
VTINADLAEQVVVDAVRAAPANVEGRPSMESNARGAEQALSRTQANLDAALLARLQASTTKSPPANASSR